MQDPIVRMFRFCICQCALGPWQMQDPIVRKTSESTFEGFNAVLTRSIRRLVGNLGPLVKYLRFFVLRSALSLKLFAPFLN